MNEEEKIRLQKIYEEIIGNAEKMRSEFRELHNQLLNSIMEITSDSEKALRRFKRERKQRLVESCYYGLGFKEAANVRPLCEN